MSRKRAPHRLKDPAETPRTDPIVLKHSRPADPVQDPDPAESNVARPTGSAGAALLLAVAAVQDVDESADAVVAPDDGVAPGQQHTGNHRKRRRRKPGTNSKARSDAKWQACQAMRQQFVPWLAHVVIVAEWCFRRWPAAQCQRRPRAFWQQGSKQYVGDHVLQLYTGRVWRCLV